MNFDLGTYAIPRETVQIPGYEDPLVVRGLTVSDLVAIIRSTYAEVERLYSLAMRGQIDGATPEALALGIGDKAPELSARVIATAADQAENWHLAIHLPFDVQKDALEKIMRLSFQRDGTPEKFVRTVAETLASANVLYGRLAPNSTNGLKD